MTPDMMVVTDLAGRKLAGERDAVVGAQDAPGGLRACGPTSRRSCTRTRRSRPGSPSPASPLDKAVLAEVICTLGSIPIADYATPSTQELPDAVARYIKAHDGLLLANHGALTVGSDLYNAYYKMETIEHFAQISLVARSSAASACSRATR